MSSNYLKGQADWLKLLGVTIFPGINLRALSSLKDSSRYVHIFPFSVIMTHNPASSFNHTNLKIVKELLIDWFITNLIGPRLSFESPGCFYFTHLQSNELSFSLCVCVCACVCVCVKLSFHFAMIDQPVAFVASLLTYIVPTVDRKKNYW